MSTHTVIFTLNNYAKADTGSRLIIDGENRGHFPAIIELGEGYHNIRVEVDSSLGCKKCMMDLQVYDKTHVVVRYNGLFSGLSISSEVVNTGGPQRQSRPMAAAQPAIQPTIQTAVPPIPQPVQQPIQQPIPQPVQQPIQQPVSAPRVQVCPVCNRPDFFLRQDQWRLCKWCNTTFDENMRPTNIKIRPEKYFRYIWDVSNVIKYDSTNFNINRKFLGIIINNFSDCKIESRVDVRIINPNAPAYCTPINFLISKGNKRVAIILVEQQRYLRYSVLETMEQCKEHNITPLRFFIELENDDDYVVDRIRKQMM